MYSSPALADGVIFVGSNDGKLYAVDAETGATKWTFAATGRIASSPAVSGGVVYVESYDSQLYAIDAATGRRRGGGAEDVFGRRHFVIACRGKSHDLRG